MSIGNEFLERRIQKFTWDQAVDGNLGADGSTVIGTLPKGALIIKGVIHIVTDVTDADAGDDSTIAFGYTGVTGAFWAATAVSVLETGKLLCILPGAADTTLTEATPNTRTNVVHAEDVDNVWILLSDEKDVLLTTAGGQAMNAGKINVFVEYLVSN